MAAWPGKFLYIHIYIYIYIYRLQYIPQLYTPAIYPSSIYIYTRIFLLSDKSSDPSFFFSLFGGPTGLPPEFFTGWVNARSDSLRHLGPHKAGESRWIDVEGWDREGEC